MWADRWKPGTECYLGIAAVKRLHGFIYAHTWLATLGPSTFVFYLVSLARKERRAQGVVIVYIVERHQLQRCVNMFLESFVSFAFIQGSL